MWPQLLGGSPGGDVWSGLVLHSETSGLSSASCRPGWGLPGDTCFTVVSPWAAGEYLLGHLDLLIPLRLGAHRAVSHTFYLIPHSCEVFCPFLTCYHRGTAMMSLAMPCCGAMVELLCPAQGSPDLSSQRPSLQHTPTPLTGSGATREKQEASWAFGSLPGLGHMHWSKAEPGLWALSKAGRIELVHLVEWLCVLSHHATSLGQGSV